MKFRYWLLLREQLDGAAYDALFDDELERLLPTLANASQRRQAEAMRGFHWTNYIRGAVRRAGIVGEDEVDEKVHEIVVRIVVHPGGLFRDYNERLHGPFPMRFKRSLANALKNITEKERNRRRHIPSIPIHQKFVPGGITPDDLVARGEPEGDPEVIEKFRETVRRHLGAMALAILDARLQGVEMKGLPITSYAAKKLVREIKGLARKYAAAAGDWDLLAHIERMLAADEITRRRRAATRGRIAARS